MTTAHELLESWSLLGTAILADAVLALAAATAWLDPIGLLLGDEDVEPGYAYGDDPQTITYCFHVARTCFPDLYMRAVAGLHGGLSLAAAADQIITGIDRSGIPLDHPEYLTYGIPIPAYGTSLAEPEWYTAHAELLPILEQFGVSLDEDTQDVTIPGDAVDVALIVAASLLEGDDTCYRDVSSLLQWLWGISGNGALDYDLEVMWEIPPLDWTSENVTLAREIIDEAEAILAQAERGRELLLGQTSWQQALQRNITLARTRLQGRSALHVLSDHTTRNPYGLAWSAAGGSHRSGT